jgi:hypothetical protein
MALPAFARRLNLLIARSVPEVAAPARLSSPPFVGNPGSSSRPEHGGAADGGSAAAASLAIYPRGVEPLDRSRQRGGCGTAQVLPASPSGPLRSGTA